MARHRGNNRLNRANAAEENGEGTYTYPLSDAEPNEPERTKRIEDAVEKILEEHSEVFKKLADE